QYDVEQARFGPMQRADGVVGRLDRVTLPAQGLLDARAEAPLVVHHQYVDTRLVHFSAACAARGSRMPSTAPPPGALAAWMAPPCAVTICCAIQSPMP